MEVVGTATVTSAVAVAALPEIQLIWLPPFVYLL